MDAENRYNSESSPHITVTVSANDERVTGPSGSSDDILPESQKTPGCLTIEQYVATSFLPEHVASKTSAGRQHYRAILKYVLSPGKVDIMFGASVSESKSRLTNDPRWPYIGEVQLRAARSEHVQELISAAIQRGYSSQTIRHIRNVVRAVFSHAIKNCQYTGTNPAAMVSLPHMMRRESHSLSLAQTVSALQLMRFPEREIAMMAILTPLNIAEICGLQWTYVNLSDHFLTRNGQLISPKTIAIRNQCYRGQMCSVPVGRRKDVPILPLMLTILRSISSSGTHSWDDFVFSNKAGGPINQINLAARRLKRIGKQLGIPWISWQVLRRTRANLISEYGTRVQSHLAGVIMPSYSASASFQIQRPVPKSGA
jgi:integrase